MKFFNYGCISICCLYTFFSISNTYAQVNAGTDVNTCSKHDTIFLNPEPKGGVWDTLITNDFFFQPGIAPGKYSVVYSVMINSILQHDTLKINIFEDRAKISFRMPRTFCEVDTILELRAVPLNGVWTSHPLIVYHGTKTYMRPVNGSHWFTFSYIDTDYCLNEDSININILEAPTVSAGSLSICENDTQAFNLIGTPRGGNWHREFFNLNSDSVSLRSWELMEAGYWEYQLKGANGCIGRDKLQLFVKEPPQAFVLNDTLCLDRDSVYLPLVGSPKGGKWIFRNETLAGDSLLVHKALLGARTLSYQVEENGCFDEASARIFLGEVIPLNLTAPVKLAAIPVDIPLFSNADLSGKKYTWRVIGPETLYSDLRNPTFTFRYSGYYNIELIVLGEEGFCNSYIYKDSLLQLVDLTESAISVYPNPAQQWLNIIMGSNEGNFTFFDSYGNQVLEQKLILGINQINLLQIKAGHYYYHITVKDEIIRKQLIVTSWREKRK